MNLAQLILSQNFARLLQALDATGELSAGKTVAAQLISLDADGTATATIGDARVALVLAGPQAKQAALQPGATLILHLEAPEQPGGDLRATLVEIRPPTGSPAPAQALPASSSPLPATPPLSTAPAPHPAGSTPPPAVTAPTVGASPLEPGRPPTPAAPGPLPENAPRPLPDAMPSRGTQAVPAAAPTPISSLALSESVEPISGSPPMGATVRPAAPGETGQPAAPVPVSPRIAIGPTLGAALMQQDSLAPLFANLRGLAEGNVALTLPKPLLAAIDRILRQAFPAERQIMTGSRLQAAVQSSGLFMEARAAAGQAPAPRGDLKAGLLALRETLLPIVETLSPEPAASRPERGAMPPAEPAADGRSPVPPPRRDGPLAAQPVSEPTLHPGEKPLAIATTLLDQTDAALDRIKLSQYASLPLDAPRLDPAQSQPQRWLTEIPLAFQHGTAILPLQVEKEPPRREAQGVSPPLWRIRFALDVEPMGPLQGVVTLQGREVGVTLWAEREETSKLLRGAAPGLETALLHADFTGGAIDIHTGQPRVKQPTAGQFLDRLS